MKTEKLFHELLGLGMNWEVQECEFDHIQGVVRIKIAETAHLCQRGQELILDISARVKSRSCVL